MTKKPLEFSKILHKSSKNLAKGDPIGLPIVNASTFNYPGHPDERPYYGRPSNPTVATTEHVISLLEGAPTVLLPSGMAAINAMLHSTLKNGDTVLVPSDCYYNTRALLSDVYARQNITLRTCPTTALSSINLDGIDLVFFETPSNPGLDICDIAKLAERAKQAGTLTAVDNTLATPLLQNPLELGADIVVMSDTKAMSGHSDLLAGHVSSHHESVMTAVRNYRKTSGALLGPMEAFLLHRGLETLEVRLQRMQANAMAAAELLSASEKISDVRYPGLSSHVGHEIARDQMKGFGSVVSFTIDTEERADAFIQSCDYIVSATSFGGVHTSAERRARWGDDVPSGFVRLSCGIEPTSELLGAIETSIKNILH